MTKEKLKILKKLNKESEHFISGGRLWMYSKNRNRWTPQEHLILEDDHNYIHNIIEDKFFNERKAYALGKKIEFRLDKGWDYIDTPNWVNEGEYRVKPEPEPEPKFNVGDYVVYKKNTDTVYIVLMVHTTDKPTIGIPGDIKTVNPGDIDKVIPKWQWIIEYPDNYGMTPVHHTENEIDILTSGRKRYSKYDESIKFDSYV